MGRWVRGSEVNGRRKGKGGTVGYQASIGPKSTIFLPLKSNKSLVNLILSGMQKT